jgi:hypothetical protein
MSSATGSKASPTPKRATSLEPRRLTPSEIASLQQDLKDGLVRLRRMMANAPDDAEEASQEAGALTLAPAGRTST